MLTLPNLPFALDALEPHISRDTIDTHYNKHHAAYVEKTNMLAEQAGMSGETLEIVISRARGKNPKLFNQAAQAWNHAFYWESLAPNAEKPRGELATAITQSFGSLERLREKFVEEGEGHFASGWLWLLVERGNVLTLVSKHDAENPVGHAHPLLTCDLWEHAYYLDRKNARKAYLEATFDNLLNWNFAAKQFAAAQGGGEAWTYPAPQKKVA